MAPQRKQRIPAIDRGQTAYTLDVVEVYRRETREVVRRFLDNQLTFDACIYSLDAALAEFVPRMEPDQLRELRIEMLANNEVVMKEMARRSQKTAD
jgi:hypothetical protein